MELVSNHVCKHESKYVKKVFFFWLRKTENHNNIYKKNHNTIYKSYKNHKISCPF